MTKSDPADVDQKVPVGTDLKCEPCMYDSWTNSEGGVASFMESHGSHGPMETTGSTWSVKW